MLHGFKKTVFKAENTFGVAQSEPENHEFLEYKQRIANVVRSLSENMLQLDKQEKQWNALVDEQRIQAENFANLYPDDDELRKEAKKAVEILNHVSKIQDATPDTQNYLKISGKVKKYLAEYTTLESEYKRLYDAKVDFEFYRKKLDDLENAKRPNGEKIDRNMSKFEDVRASYERQLEGVVSKQKQFYSKRTEVFQAAFVCYWLAHGTHMSNLAKNIKPVLDFAASKEKASLALELGKEA